MQYALLSVSKFDKSPIINIGDYIQALASSQYYPTIDRFIDRDEELKSYHDDPIKVIMNGWYMHHPHNWPPSNKIIPLFVAFHINTSAQKNLLSPESIEYLKKHEPIGCRDLHTLNLLKEHGVDAYFSACMTLTLGKNFHSPQKEDKSYIVDPLFLEKLRIKDMAKALMEILKHPCDISKLCRIKELKPHRGGAKKRILKIALFYKEYTRMFGRKIVMESTYISQANTFYCEGFSSDAERLKEAERLIRLYAKAKLVITSRIHCALPCLGVETPVIFLENKQDIEESTCRMGGLRDLFNIVKMSHGRLIADFEIATPITEQNFPTNKTLWKSYAEALQKRCIDFMTQQD